MFFMKNYKINRVIIKHEQYLSNELSNNIFEFLARQDVIFLKKLYINRDIELRKLSKTKEQNKTLETSGLWGDEFRFILYYWPDDSYHEKLIKINNLIDATLAKIGFNLSYEQLKNLELKANTYKNKRQILKTEDRNFIKSLNISSDSEIMTAVMIATIFGATSAAGSIIESYSQSSIVYDSIRRVNSNYASLSDIDIWFKTLVLSIVDPSAYQGMVNLSKGAYFEQIVADNTGGVLHENFNTPDTDILIDGELYQIKATDNLDIIDSVNSSVKIISTTEISEHSRAIDSGYSNLDVTSNTENALGGDPFDTAGGISDGALLFSGSIGVIAVLRGLAAAGEYLEKNPVVKTGNNLDDLESEWLQLAEASLIGLEATMTLVLHTAKNLWNFAIVTISWLLNGICHVYNLFSSRSKR
jgi:hypothetical protein